MLGKPPTNAMQLGTDSDVVHPARSDAKIGTETNLA